MKMLLSFSPSQSLHVLFVLPCAFSVITQLNHQIIFTHLIGNSVKNLNNIYLQVFFLCSQLMLKICNKKYIKRIIAHSVDYNLAVKTLNSTAATVIAITASNSIPSNRDRIQQDTDQSAFFLFCT